jgi:hypothetical protein
MAKIHETMDYEKFELLPVNRNVEKTRALEESMKKHGWISAYPMHVVSNGNGKLKIKAGHHRFYVARELGLAVKYVECNDSISIYELEKATNKWIMADYLASYVRAAKPAYTEVKRFCETTGIGISTAISMLGGHTAGTKNFNIKFKNGDFRLASRGHAYTVGDIVLHCKKHGIKWAHDYRFVEALSRIVQIKEIDVKVLKHKIRTFPFLLTKQPTLAAYQQMLEDIYNRQSRVPVPLSFLADQAARERNVARKA